VIAAAVLAHEASLGDVVLVIPPILVIAGLLAVAKRRAERGWRANDHDVPTSPTERGE
jgi:hypothetical protein